MAERSPQSASPPTLEELLQAADARKDRNDWRSLTHLQRHLPEGPLQGGWVVLADQLAFAHGQLGAFEEAIPLAERAFGAEPSARRASCCAYLYYAASMAWVAPGANKPPRSRRKRRGKRTASLRQGAATTSPNAPPSPLPYRQRMQRAGCDRQRLRNGFLAWIERALRLHGEHPSAMKDLYRLGIFHAQVEQAKDKLALRAFLAAINRYHAMTASQRRDRHDLRKVLVRCLYAGGRSAFRLGQLGLARKLAFRAIREDEGSDHIEPVHKLGLAGRICMASGELEHAERAFRKALDRSDSRRHDYLYGYLAEVALRRGTPQDALRWIEEHTRPERRSSAMWRRLGDVLLACGEPERALAAYESALDRDKGGRHLTWTAIGQLHLQAGRLTEAERSFRKANDFRRKRFSSEHRPALEGLRSVAEARGRKARAEQHAAHIKKVWPDASDKHPGSTVLRLVASAESQGVSAGEPEAS